MANKYSNYKKCLRKFYWFLQELSAFETIKSRLVINVI